MHISGEEVHDVVISSVVPPLTPVFEQTAKKYFGCIPIMVSARIKLPIRIEIEMSNSAGVFQVDELLKRKLRNSSIAPYVQVLARIEGETEKRLLEFYTI